MPHGGTGPLRLLKRVKTNWRRKLTNESLTDQIRMIIHAPSIDEFEPQEAVHLWSQNGERRRRPTIQPYGERPEQPSSDYESCSSDSVS